MKAIVWLVSAGLCLLFCLQLLTGLAILNFGQNAESLSVQFHKSTLNASIEATKHAAEGEAIIAHVEAQLNDIVAHSRTDVELSSAVRTILCDSLLFDEETTNVKVKDLAKSMVAQSCDGIHLPKLPKLAK